MPNINDMIDKADTEIPDFERAHEDIDAEQSAAPSVPRFAIPEWLKAQTGAGGIEEYINHPLNFTQSRGMAQIIRGLTGIIGELKYAVLDIALGVLQFGKERKARQVVEVARHVHTG